MQLISEKLENKAAIKENGDVNNRKTFFSTKLDPSCALRLQTKTKANKLSDSIRLERNAKVKPGFDVKSTRVTQLSSTFIVKRVSKQSYKHNGGVYQRGLLWYGRCAQKRLFERKICK